MNTIPMQVRNPRGKVLTYLVDERAQVDDVVEMPLPFFLGNGRESGTIVARESEYVGNLVTARWCQAWQHTPNGVTR